MTIGQLILYMMIGTPQERSDLKNRWHSFCERHLIADDPYDELTKKIREEQRKQGEQSGQRYEDPRERESEDSERRDH